MEPCRYAIMMRLGVGISDFKKIIESNNFYVDKSLLIKDLIDFNDEVTLITRPRRFGKTLNLDMLRSFFSLEHKATSSTRKALSLPSMFRSAISKSRVSGKLSAFTKTFSAISSISRVFRESSNSFLRCLT